MGFWAGVVGELNRIEDRNERRDEFNKSVRERRMDNIIQARLRYGAGSTTSSADGGGVETAVGSTVEDSAVLNSNVEYLKSLGLDADTISGWVAIGPTAVADLRDRVETYVEENVERPWLTTPEEITRRAGYLQPSVIAGKTIDLNSDLDSFGIDLTEEEAQYVRAITPPPTPSRVVVSDNYVPQVSGLGSEDISKIFDSATQDVVNTLETQKQQINLILAPDYTNPTSGQPLTEEERTDYTKRVADISMALDRIDNNEGFVPLDIIKQYGMDTIVPYLLANPGLYQNAKLGQLPGSWGRVIDSIPTFNTREGIESYEGTYFYVEGSPLLRSKN